MLAPDGVTSVGVDYGGFHLGLGLFALIGAVSPTFLKPGLVAASITMTLVIVMRATGMAVDGVRLDRPVIIAPRFLMIPGKHLAVLRATKPTIRCFGR